MVKKNKDIYDIWLILQRITYMIRRAREFEIKQELGITMAKAVAILAIKAANKPITPSDLSRKIHREAHSVHELVNRMEKENLVKKVRNSKQSRKVIIELTPKGEEIYTKARDSKIINSILSVLSTQERNQFYCCLDKIKIKALTELALNKEM